MRREAGGRKISWDMVAMKETEGLSEFQLVEDRQQKNIWTTDIGGSFGLSFIAYHQGIPLYSLTLCQIQDQIFFDSFPSSGHCRRCQRSLSWGLLCSMPHISCIPFIAVPGSGPPSWLHPCYEHCQDLNKVSCLFLKVFSEDSLF